jgi:hypothetical protein
MFDWLIRLLGGVPMDLFDLALERETEYEVALMEIAALDTPNAAHGVKKAVKIANEALGVEN